MAGAYDYACQHDELKDSTEAALVGGFLDEMRDVGDCYDDMSVVQRAEHALDLNSRLEELLSQGFLVFGLRKRRKVRFQQDQQPTNWETTYLFVFRKNHRSIVRSEGAEILAAKLKFSPGWRAS